ncbi:MAG: hypothetical protein AB1503_01475 [Bacillota bacterium]|nr:hypothetical protein [Bacillota bacterium]
MPRTRSRRARVSGWARAGAGLVLAVALAWIPSPFLALAPGHVFDLSGVVKVGGGGHDPGVSGLGMVTVEARRARGWEVALDLFHPGRELVWARSLPLPVEQYMNAERLLFVESVQFAGVTALSLMGRPVEVAGDGILVQWVTPGAPLAARLQPGDILEGYPTSFHLRRVLWERGWASVRVRGETVELGPDDLRGLGLVTLHPRVPGLSLEVANAGGVGGPSAGLACALELLRQLGELPLAPGAKVVATGSIDPSGEVGRTGGVALKARAAKGAGADLFLVPSGQEEEARGAAPGLRVVGVSSLAQAVAAMRDLR